MVRGLGGVSWPRAIAASLPPVLAVVAMVAFAIAETAGLDPLSFGTPRNIAEAAALGGSAEVVRLLQRGEDPARIMTIRPEIISPAVRHISALEAAVWTRRLELVRLLERRGAIAAGERPRLAALAADVGAADIATYLGGPAERTEDNRASDQILDRNADQERER